jgi:hypothetical protein
MPIIWKAIDGSDPSGTSSPTLSSGVVVYGLPAVGTV